MRGRRSADGSIEMVRPSVGERRQIGFMDPRFGDLFEMQLWCLDGDVAYVYVGRDHLTALSMMAPDGRIIVVSVNEEARLLARCEEAEG